MLNLTTNNWSAERDRQVELRVKFGVHGMHGRLNHIHPIIADGKAKKLANANGKPFSQFNSIESIVSNFGQYRSKHSDYNFQCVIITAVGVRCSGITESGSAFCATIVQTHSP